MGNFWSSEQVCVVRLDVPMPEKVELRLTIPPRDRTPSGGARGVAGSRPGGRGRARGGATADRPAGARPPRCAPAIVARLSVERGTATNSPTQVASRSKWCRIEALLRNRAFIDDYLRALRARDAWRAGSEVAFPPGHYWLRRFANVSVAAT